MIGDPPAGRRSSAERQQTLRSNGFDLLLSTLSPDPATAEHRFQTIRRRLIKLFEWRHCAFPEDLADETISRVARRLEEGLRIREDDPYRFFCGVAFLIFKETLREQAQRSKALAELKRLPPAPIEPAGDPRRECLERCLAELDGAKRELIVGYYYGERQVKIRHRRRLAERLDISAATLRLRALRIRTKLEKCTARCLRRLPPDETLRR